MINVTCLLFILMDRFVKRSLPDHIRPATTPPLAKKPKHSDKQGIVSATFRTQEFGENFYESGSKLFCRPCNVLVDHSRKSVIWKHIQSKVCGFCVIIVFASDLKFEHKVIFKQFKINDKMLRNCTIIIKIR